MNLLEMSFVCRLPVEHHAAAVGFAVPLTVFEVLFLEVSPYVTDPGRAIRDANLPAERAGERLARGLNSCG